MGGENVFHTSVVGLNSTIKKEACFAIFFCSILKFRTSKVQTSYSGSAFGLLTTDLPCFKKKNNDSEQAV